MHLQLVKLSPGALRRQQQTKAARRREDARMAALVPLPRTDLQLEILDILQNGAMGHYDLAEKLSYGDRQRRNHIETEIFRLLKEAKIGKSSDLPPQLYIPKRPVYTLQDRPCPVCFKNSDTCGCWREG